MGKYTREQLAAMTPAQVKAIRNEMATQATPVQVTETPELPSDPAELRKLLAGLPADRVKALRAEIEKAKAEKKLDPKDQFGGVFRSILSKFTGGSMTEQGVDPGASETVISALNAMDTSVRNPNPPTGGLMERIAGAVQNFKGKMGADQERGKGLIEKVGFRRAVETPIRSVLEPATFGASEPIISGIKAGFKAGMDGDFSTENLVEKFRGDVAQREGDQALLPAVDQTAQAAGFIAGPTGVLRKGATKALRATAPGRLAVQKVGQALTTRAEDGIIKSATKSVGRIAMAGGRGAIDNAEQQLARKIALEAPGFAKNEPSVGEAASFGGKITAAMQAIPELAGAAGHAARGTMSVFLGPGKKHLDYYWKNFDRLRQQEPDIAKVSDGLMEAVDKIKNDFQTAQLGEKEAQAALKGLERSIRTVKQQEGYDLAGVLATAKQELEQAGKVQKYQLATFQKALPAELLDDVKDSVKQVRKGTADAYVEKLNHLTTSNAQIPVGDVDGIFNAAIGELSVGVDGRSVGEAATAARGRLEKYRAELMELAEKNGGVLNARDAAKVIKMLGEDVEWMRGTPGFMGKADSAVSKVYGELEERIKAGVEGYDKVKAAQNKAGGLLDQAKEYFASDEQIIASLARVNDPHTGFLARRALEELGEATGKDFSKLLAAVDDAKRLSEDPMAQAATKFASPEAERVRKLEEEMHFYRRPGEMEAAIQGELAGSPQAAALGQATQAREATEQLDKLFRGFSDMSIEGKIKAVVRGHQATAGRFKMLSQLSDEDFMQAVNDLATLTALDKGVVNGSRKVNMFTALGYAGGSQNSDAAKRIGITGFAALMGYLSDTHGPATSRKILDAVGGIKGLITNSKLADLDLPDNIKQDLMSQFAKAMYFGTQVNHDPVVTVGPEEAMLIRREIQTSSMSNVQKAKALSALNGKNQAKGLRKLLIGDTPVPQEQPEQAPQDYDAVMQQMSAAPR